MKTAIIISDTHGNRTAVGKLQPLFKECDYIFHLGDVLSDVGAFRAEFQDKLKLVNGNCDLFKTGSDELVIEIEGVKIFATHGHLYSAKTTLYRLAERADELGCNIVLYGHTHIAREDEIAGIKLINPGNMTSYTPNSYAYLTVNGDKAVAKIVNV